MGAPFLEKEEISLEDYRLGIRMSPSERDFHLKNGGVLWIPAYVNNINQEYWEILFNSFTYTNLSHRILARDKWAADERHFLGEALGHRPTDGEFVEHYDESGSRFRFKLDYILRNPHFIVTNVHGINGNAIATEAFLARADIIGQTDFAYLKRFFPDRVEEDRELVTC